MARCSPHRPRPATSASPGYLVPAGATRRGCRGGRPSPTGPPFAACRTCDGPARSGRPAPGRTPPGVTGTSTGGSPRRHSAYSAAWDAHTTGLDRSKGASSKPAAGHPGRADACRQGVLDQGGQPLAGRVRVARRSRAEDDGAALTKGPRQPVADSQAAAGRTSRSPAPPRTARAASHCDRLTWCGAASHCRSPERAAALCQP